jgi:hypothetical protein
MLKPSGCCEILSNVMAGGGHAPQLCGLRGAVAVLA